MHAQNLPGSELGSRKLFFARRGLLSLPKLRRRDINDVLRMRRLEEHADDDMPIVTKRRVNELVAIAMYLRRHLCEGGRARVNRVDPRRMQRIRLRARIADDAKSVLTGPIRGRDRASVYPNEVLRVAHAGPAAVMEIPGRIATADLWKRQAIAVVMMRRHGASTHRAESGEHLLELRIRHLVCSVQEKLRPEVRRCVSVAAAEDIPVLAV